MSMSNRDFESLADELAEVRPRKGQSVRYRIWLQSVYAVAHTCRMANHAFSRERFVGACEERTSYAP